MSYRLTDAAIYRAMRNAMAYSRRARFIKRDTSEAKAYAIIARAYARVLRERAKGDPLGQSEKCPHLGTFRGKGHQVGDPEMREPRRSEALHVTSRDCSSVTREKEE